MNTISETSMARSVENFSNLNGHFERFVDKKTQVGVDDRLAEAFKPLEVS